jgi:hypothetical protein
MWDSTPSVDPNESEMPGLGEKRPPSQHWLMRICFDFRALSMEARTHVAAIKTKAPVPGVVGRLPFRRVHGFDRMRYPGRRIDPHRSGEID